MKVLLMHPGTQYANHLARELNSYDLLEKYITSFAVTDRSILFRIFKQQLRYRIAGGLPSQRLKMYPMVEIFHRISSYFIRDQEHLLYKRNSFFQDKVIANDIRDSTTVIGYDTSSWKVAEYCRKNGIEFVLDVSIGHPVSKERIFTKLRSEYPLWKDVAYPKNKKLLELEQLELDLATKIIVPSNFVKQTLIENYVSPSKIFVNPFGTDTQVFQSNIVKGMGEKIVFLFFGSLSARKGLPLLLKAWSAMDPKRSELLIAGYGSLPESQVLPKGVRFLGAIAPEKRAALYDQADVLVFPSFFEGFALVQVEAAASGLPIIGTLNSGADEIVEDGHNGFVIDPGNMDQLIESMNFFVANREMVRLMSARIRERIEFFTWRSYGKRWKTILELK